MKNFKNLPEKFKIIEVKLYNSKAYRFGITIDDEPYPITSMQIIFDAREVTGQINCIAAQVDEDGKFIRESNGDILLKTVSYKFNSYQMGPEGIFFF